MTTAHHFAVVPAAGHGVRLGGAKLLLPLRGQPLILHTLAAWQKSKVERTIVVIRRDDLSLADAIRPASAEVVIPESPPPDMKASLQVALRYIDEKYSPSPSAAFLVAPADMPQLSTKIINRLIERHEADGMGRIQVPMLHGKRGHPVLFPWQFADLVRALSEGEVLNTLVERHPAELVPCEDLVANGEYPFADVDTPEEYRQLPGI